MLSNLSVDESICRRLKVSRSSLLAELEKAFRFSQTSFLSYAVHPTVTDFVRWKIQGHIANVDWDSARLITDSPSYSFSAGGLHWIYGASRFMRDIYGYKKTALSCARYTPSSRRLPRIRLRAAVSFRPWPT